MPRPKDRYRSAAGEQVPGVHDITGRYKELRGLINRAHSQGMKGLPPPMTQQMTNPHFHAGQRVVCVDASPNRLCGVKLLTRGAIYVVRAIDVKPKWQAPGWGVHLEEIRIVHPAGMEWPFHPCRFRPITPRKTDISMFTRMLAKPRKTPAQLPLPIRLPGELPLVFSKPWEERRECAPSFTSSGSRLCTRASPGNRRRPPHKANRAAPLGSIEPSSITAFG